MVVETMLKSHLILNVLVRNRVMGAYMFDVYS